MKLPSRYNEGVMLIKQDNDAQQLTVLDMNDKLRAMLDYDELPEDAPLSQFLGSRTERTLREDICFEDDAFDLFDVLSKHRAIRLLKQDGMEVQLECKIFRMAASDRHHQFRLVLSKAHMNEHLRTSMNQLHEQFEGYCSVDNNTDLPDKSAILHGLELTQRYVDDKNIDACFVALRCLNIPNPGKVKEVNQILQHIGHIIARNLRSDDVIGRIDNNMLGMILIDINSATIHLALNRIKHMMRHDPLIWQDGTTFVPDVQQGCVLLNRESPPDVIQDAVNLLNADVSRDIVVKRNVSMI